jgi:hypothetical protein
LEDLLPNSCGARHCRAVHRHRGSTSLSHPGNYECLYKLTVPAFRYFGVLTLAVSYAFVGIVVIRHLTRLQE